jgi:hypothetical protein
MEQATPVKDPPEVCVFEADKQYTVIVKDARDLTAIGMIGSEDVHVSEELFKGSLTRMITVRTPWGAAMLNAVRSVIFKAASEESGLAETFGD